MALAFARNLAIETPFFSRSRWYLPCVCLLHDSSPEEATLWFVDKCTGIALRISSFSIRDPEVTLEAYHVKIAQRVTRAIEMFEYFNGARIADP